MKKIQKKITFLSVFLLIIVFLVVCGVYYYTRQDTFAFSQQNNIVVPNNLVATLGNFNVNFVEKNNLDGYLGPNIHPLKESDWMHNSDIIKQVKILTNKKSTAMEKAIAIANWVKQSRPYDYAAETCTSGTCVLTPANALLSVVDIYNEKTGICFDSAIITVAMFRLVNIPARITFPVFGASHAIAQAYINNQWVIFDSTFGSGPALVNVVEFPPDVVSYSGEIKNPSAYKQSPMQPGEYLQSKIYKQFNIASDNSVFGTVTLANIPSYSKLYAKDSLFDNGGGTDLPLFFNITRTDSKDVYYAVYNNQVNYIFSSSQPSDVCISGTSGSTGTCTSYSKMSTNANLILPRIMFLDGFNKYVPGTQVNSVIDMSESYRYLETVKLPFGKYRITYYANLPGSTGTTTCSLGGDCITTPGANGGPTDIAYADFNVLQGGIAKLTSDKFIIANGANVSYFNAVIKRLNNVWTNYINNPQI
jgi:hypothetical protein